MAENLKNKNDQNDDDFYAKFKESLILNEAFPSAYTFKFIVPTDNKRMAELQRIFDDARPQFQTKASRNDKYTSLTVVVYVVDADEVISYYKEAAKVENVIML